MKLQIKIDGKTYEAEVEVMDEDAGPGDAQATLDAAAAQPMPAPEPMFRPLRVSFTPRMRSNTAARLTGW